MPEGSVRVGLVIGAEPARVVHDLGEPVDVGVEDTGVLGVVDEQACCPFGHRRLEGLELDVPLRPDRNLDDLEARGRGRGRVRRVGGERGDHLVALVVTAARVVRLHDQDVGEDRVRAALRLQSDLVHPGERLQAFAELPQQLQQALDGLGRLVRMELGELRRPRDLLVDHWRVLGGRGADRGMSIATLWPSVICESRMKWRSTCGWPSSGSAGCAGRRCSAGQRVGRRSVEGRHGDAALPRLPCSVMSGSCHAACWKCSRSDSSEHLLEGRREAVEVVAGVLLGDAVERAARQLREVCLQAMPPKMPRSSSAALISRRGGPLGREVDDELLERQARQPVGADPGNPSPGGPKVLGAGPERLAEFGHASRAHEREVGRRDDPGHRRAAADDVVGRAARSVRRGLEVAPEEVVLAWARCRYRRRCRCSEARRASASSRRHARKPATVPPKVWWWPSGCSSPQAMSAPYEPGSRTTPSDVGSTPAIRQAPGRDRDLPHLVQAAPAAARGRRGSRSRAPPRRHALPKVVEVDRSRAKDRGSPIPVRRAAADVPRSAGGALARPYRRQGSANARSPEPPSAARCSLPRPSRRRAAVRRRGPTSSEIRLWYSNSAW